jgi:hypothetical protein
VSPVRDALAVVLSLLACVVLVGGAMLLAHWSPSRPLPVPNCEHPVSLGDQPYCPTPVPTP